MAKNVLVKPLTIIINQMIVTGIFPDQLKISKVIPLYKAKDQTILSNYRPIALLPSISKIFEYVLLERITNYFLVVFFFTEKNYLMSSLAMSVRPSVRLSVCPSVRPSVRHLWKYLWNAVAV